MQVCLKHGEEFIKALQANYIDDLSIDLSMVIYKMLFFKINTIDKITLYIELLFIIRTTAE